MPPRCRSIPLRCRSMPLDAARCRSISIRGLGAADVFLLDPGHQVTEAFAGFFDAMFFALFQELFVVWQAGLILSDPAFGKLAGLNFLECFLHFFLHRAIDDFWPDGNIA